VTISAEGLKRRQRVNKNNQDESIYLAPLQEIAATGRTLSKVLIDLYHNEWGGDVKKIFEESGVEP
jgi:glutamate--cysteine ligase